MSHYQSLNIDTPENVIFGYEVAGIGSRFLAALLDSTLILVTMLVANITGFLLVSALGFSSDSMAPGVITAFTGFLSFLMFWGYYIFFEIIWNGQSPGKRLQNLRVVRTDGTPVGTVESAIRNLVRIVDFLPLFYGVGVITMFSNSQARRLGDFAAGTLVVREDSSVYLDDLRIAESDMKTFRRSLSLGAEDDIVFPLDRLSAQDVQLAEDYLQRRYELRNSESLASQIAGSLLTKMEINQEITEGLTPENILIRVVLTYREKPDLSAE